MNALEILNDRITVNQINGKTEAVAALREVREAIQALPATGEAARVAELEGKLASVSADFEYAQQAVDNVLRLLPDRTTDSWEDAVNGWLKETEKLRAERDAALAEVANLNQQVYVPGSWECDICNFEWVRSVLNPVTGAIGSPKIEEIPVCPNDGNVMRRATWRNDAIAFASRYSEIRAEIDRLKATTVPVEVLRYKDGVMVWAQLGGSQWPVYAHPYLPLDKCEAEVVDMIARAHEYAKAKEDK